MPTTALTTAALTSVGIGERRNTAKVPSSRSESVSGRSSMTPGLAGRGGGGNCGYP